MGNVIRRILMLVWWLPLAVAGQVESFDVKIANAIPDSTFRIEYIVSNTRIPGYLDVHVKFMAGDSVPSAQYLDDSLFLSETVSGNYGNGDFRGKMVPMEKQKVIGKRYDVVTVLMDISSSMWREIDGKAVYMDSAKALVDSIVRSLSAPYAVKIYNFDEIWYERTLQGETSFLNAQKPATARYTYLYENVANALDRMSDADGKKLLIVIGDGEDDQSNRKPEERYERKTLIEKIRALDDSYVIYPILFGTKTYAENVEPLVRATHNRADSMSMGVVCRSLKTEVKEFRKWPATHTILVKSNVHPHAGRVMQLEARLGSLRDTASYRLGGLFNPWNEQTNWQLDALIGGGVIMALFVIFAVYIPRRQWRDFRSKYVKFYWQVKQEGVRRYDPLTKFPFRDEDEVVVRCEHMTSMETWQYEGRKGGKDGGNRKRKNRCIYYPSKCESGHSPGGSSDFFAQTGVFKQLFWVFMAALGAFAGWGLWALFENNKKVYWNLNMDRLAATPWVQERWGLQGTNAPLEDSVRYAREAFLNPFFEQLVLAGIMSALIVFLIAISAEIAQARGGFSGWNIVKGILRSALRGIIGGVMGILVFAFFGYLQGFIFDRNLYLPGLLAMLLLGVVLGNVLTVKSGTRQVRGTLAGLIAGFVAFHVYYLPMLIYQTKGYEGPKLFAFVVFGALLALILSEGSPALEASEMEIWTMRKKYGMVHITDLLRKNEDVTIGRGPTATIRMKVRHTPALNAPGNVTQTFANLVIRNEVVYLIPEIFTEINGDPVAPNERVALFDGDKISFVHKSPSHIIYREHRRGTHPKWRYHITRDRKARRLAARLEADNASAASAASATTV
jgi:hypothetical protein